MTREISEVCLARLSSAVENRMGLYFPRERWKDLSRGITRASRQFGFKDIDECCEWLLTNQLNPHQTEVLASHLTVGETYFFRDPACYEALEQSLVPEWVRTHPDPRLILRIWSAGCSTGEEPYTIAMVLDKPGAILCGRKITILATDINPESLRKAGLGAYGKWSFRKTPPALRERCFNKVSDSSCRILPRYRSRVSFGYLNLVDDNYPSLLNHTNALDIIFCRNVLMYFSEYRRQEVLKRLHRCLAENGCLIVSAVEAALVSDPSWVRLHYPGNFIFRKTSSPGALPRTFPPAAFKPPAAPVIPVKPVKMQQLLSGPASSILRNKVASEDTPSPAAGLFAEAARLAEQNQNDEAAEKLACILKLDKDNITAKILMARVRANQGQLVEALEWCDAALAGDKLNAPVHYLMATILLEMARTNEARAALKKVLYLDPGFVLAHFVLGNMAWQKGKIKEARRQFEHALSIIKEKYQEGDLIPESGGLTAGRLGQIIQTLIDNEAVA